MNFREELAAQVKQMFSDQWSSRNGQSVPTPENLKLGNDAIKFERATVLYADLSGSTVLVDSNIWWFAAEVYKTFLHCAAKIIKQEGGSITAYDGDRIMAVFLGDFQTSNAAKCALKINYAVQNIINPALTRQYPEMDYVVKQVVGIDTSEIHAARTGVRGDNDIVWVGRSANYAAKLTELKLAERTWITEAAYIKLTDASKMGGSPLTNMWKKYTWTQNENKIIYGSAWFWEV